MRSTLRGEEREFRHSLNTKLRESIYLLLLSSGNSSSITSILFFFIGTFKTLAYQLGVYRINIHNEEQYISMDRYKA